MKVQLVSETIKQKQAESSVSTVRRHSEKWFDDTYIKRKSDPVEPFTGRYLEEGKMYTYRYDPKYAKQLDFYDNQPIMLCLGHLETKSGYNTFGLNLSYIPPKLRVQILDTIIRVFRTRVINRNADKINRGKTNNLAKLPLSYDICKKILRGSGFEFAIRSYIYGRIETEPMIISYEEWYHPAQFPSHYIKKLNVKAVYMRYKKQFSADYSIGKKDPKAKIEKVKIKDINKIIDNK